MHLYFNTPVLRNVIRIYNNITVPSVAETIAKENEKHNYQFLIYIEYYAL